MRNTLVSIGLLIFIFGIVLSEISSQGTIACEGVFPSTMTTGDSGYVRDTGANNVRENAGLDGRVVGALQPGEQFTVLSEPKCVEGYIWYEVENENISGWTAESGDGVYWLLPLLDVQDDDLSELNLIHEFTCESERLPYAFDFSEASNRLVISCGGDKQTVSVYSLPSGDLINQVEMTAYTAHFVINDTRLLVETDDSLQLLDIETFEPTVSLDLDNARYTHLSLDRRFFFRAEEDTAYVYDVETLTELTTFTHLSGESITSIVTDPYNSHLLLATAYGSSSLFTLDSELNIISSQEIPFSFEAISPDMTFAIDPICTFANHGCQSAEIRFYELPTLQLIHSMPSDHTDIRHVTFTPDGHEFVLGGCYMQAFDFQSRESIPIMNISFSCFEPYLISSDWHYLIVQSLMTGDSGSGLQLYEFNN